ncbi:DUF2799 domain-containing protein [Vibrio cholerae]|uniref:DUF2799 domain-containing protein n=1 Tax=Vibrio cholerae TaxID=666 RepID=UPI003F98E537
MKKWIVMGCTVLLAACAASESQLVQEGNWYQIGYQDAVTGHTQRSYKSLMEIGSAKLGDYEQGYQKGLEQYCNPDVAYQIGLSGQYYEGICEGTEQAQRFRMEWQRGWNEYNQ